MEARLRSLFAPNASTAIYTDSPCHLDQGVDLDRASAHDGILLTAATPRRVEPLSFPMFTRKEIAMLYKRFPVVLVTSMVMAVASGAAPAKMVVTSLPEGFVPLFNGKDFAGWHGLKTMDPRTFESLATDEKAKVLAAGTEDLKKHWRVEDGVIINDGQGVYLTTDKDYGEELHKCKSGILPTPITSSVCKPTRARAACGTTASERPAKIRS
jgi:hypothetical protein